MQGAVYVALLVYDPLVFVGRGKNGGVDKKKKKEVVVMMCAPPDSTATFSWSLGAVTDVSRKYIRRALSQIANNKI